ncbi:class I SAM-dependent methyltransferase [Elongatibacter sediminis]|uniref:Methyltransferase domain-containing protein n=1 Tax=Elongatibacter sediminis TaxID=3119006 RepID=A0AAW9RD95_9GAMM
MNLFKRLRFANDPRPGDRAVDTDSVPAYPGLCNLCGATGEFSLGDCPPHHAARAFRCPSCGAALRFRNEAAALVEVIGRGRHLSLRTLIADPAVRKMSLYHIGIGGPVRQWLRQVADYCESTLFEDGHREEVRDGVHHQDLVDLSFADGRFDLVTSSHVMEHVSDPWAALTEIHRVLKPGGHYVFSIPIGWPPPETSIRRATITDGKLEHHLPAAYHESPGGSPSLVFTDFGSDLLDHLEEAGFQARQCRPNIGLQHAFIDSVFVATRPG